jgi:hypothetical protein
VRLILTLGALALMYSWTLFRLSHRSERRAATLSAALRRHSTLAGENRRAARFLYDRRQDQDDSRFEVIAPPP